MLASEGLRRAMKKSDRLMEYFLPQRDPARFGKDGNKPGSGGFLTMTLTELDEFIQSKRLEAALISANKIIEGTAVDVTPGSES